ncbi:MAG: TDT family transporter, partial [Aeromonadaceae bacterium]|nr:TDT family transporter [Aeromonadaceae bacterium]
MQPCQHSKLARIPTPVAGLALAIASLGWCLENAAPLAQYAKWTSAWIASLMLLSLALKFIRHPRLLRDDLAHPVVGSVVPTAAMGWMVISHSLGQWNALLGQGLWLLAIAMHTTFLACFIYHRAKDFALHHMVPSWFVPPVGLIVADVAFPGGAMRPLAEAIFYFGLLAYAVMLPAMLYRLIFCQDVPDLAKPTIAILAAPASLSLAGYLTVAEEPSMLLVGLLAGIAVLMTLLIYVAFLHLLRLPFNP